MKVLVLSDSHGEVDAMIRAAKRVSPEMIFFLGDGWRDAETLAEKFPHTPFYQVPGNCDFQFRKPAEELVTLEGKRILLCHGHTYGVKEGLWKADEEAEEQNLDAFLFGHTHTPLVELRGKTLFMNPGSIGLGYPPSYGVLTVEKEKIDGRIFQFPSKRRFFFR